MTKPLTPEWKENNDYWFNVASSILVEPFTRQAELERMQEPTDQTPANSRPTSLWDIYL